MYAEEMRTFKTVRWIYWVRQTKENNTINDKHRVLTKRVNLVLPVRTARGFGSFLCSRLEYYLQDDSVLLFRVDIPYVKDLRSIIYGS